MICIHDPPKWFSKWKSCPRMQGVTYLQVRAPNTLYPPFFCLMETFAVAEFVLAELLWV